MHGIRIVGAKQLRLEDVIVFEPSEFVLVDVVNDPLQANGSRNFLTAPGVFVYDLELSFDARRVLDERIKAVKLEVFDKHPGQLPPPKNAQTPRSTRAKFEHQLVLNEFQRRKISPVLERDLELGIALPNDSIPLIGVKNEQLHVNLRQRREVLLDVPVQTQTRGLSRTVEAPIQEPKQLASVPSDRTSSAVARETLRNGSVDPAKSNQFSVPLLPTLEGMLDVGKREMAPRYNPYDDQGNIDTVKNVSRTPAINSLQSVRNSLLFSRSQEYLGNVKVQTLQRTQRREFNVASNVSAELGNQIVLDTFFRTEKFRVEIDKQSIGNVKSIFIRLTLVLSESMAKSAVRLESAVFQIQHAEQLKRLMVPKVPPSIESVSNSINGTMFKVTQNDPIASKVLVLKRVITPDPYDEEPSLMFEELDLNYGEEATLKDDWPGNWLPNQTMYTAIIQHDGQDGPFDSLIFDGIHNPNVQSVDQEDGSTRISIVATNSLEGVDIRIGRISPNVVMLSLYREQLNALGSRRQRTTIVRSAENSESTVISEGTEGIEFFDSNVVRNGKYRYYCVLTLRGGHRTESADDEILIRRTTKDELPLNVELRNVSAVLSDNETFAVSIDVLTEQKSSTFQYVKELLGEQAANQEFLAEIDSNRDELNDIMVFYVQRIDLKTGKRIALGFHKSGTFVDDEALAERLQVQAVRPGRSYVYSFAACLVPPSTFLSGVFNRLSTGKKIGIKDIEYLANKFDNYVIRNFGVIPSNAQLISKLDVEQLILVGNTGLSYDVAVETPRPLNVIDKVELDNSLIGCKVFWNLSNFANDLVDYCNIFVGVNGNKEMLGSVRNSGVSSSLYFVDDRYHRSIGERYYSVVAVFYDGSNSTEVQSRSIRNISNINLNVLKRALGDEKIKGNQSPIDQFNRRSIKQLAPQKTLQLSELIKTIDESLNRTSTEESENLQKEELVTFRNQTSSITKAQDDLLSTQVSNGQDKLSTRFSR
jgi:hypothetical protein